MSANSAMGGRKFRLGTHRKNEERKRKRKREQEDVEQCDQPLTLVISIPHNIVTVPSLTISLPVASYISGLVHSSETLGTRLAASLVLPPLWMTNSSAPLTLCKLRVGQEEQASRPDITTIIRLSDNLEWTLFIFGKELCPQSCPLLRELPLQLTSVAAVGDMMRLLDSTKLCVGNSDEKFLELWHHRSLTLHGSSSKYNYAWM